MQAGTGAIKCSTPLTMLVEHALFVAIRIKYRTLEVKARLAELVRFSFYPVSGAALSFDDAHKARPLTSRGERLVAKKMLRKRD